MKKKIVLIWLLLLLVALIIDTLTPLGFADYFLYSGILFLFMYSNKKYILLAGITSIAFIIIGHYLSPNNFLIPLPIAISNRILGILLVVFIMFIMLKFSKRGITLLEKINELEITNKELESFNFISSHDLQEPLRKIQNFVSVLLKEKNISDDGKYYLGELSKTSKQMRMLIEDLLKYSRINKIDLNFEKVKLNNVFDEVITNFKETIAEKTAKIQIEGNCDASIVPPLFRQVICNLIDNSLKFSYPDRQLRIFIRSEIIYSNKLIPELSSNLNYCHISVTDNGIGFDSQYNERVFDFFERLNGQEYPGTGLGLAICRKIVETHNGIIKANGELNKGAHFDIYIPA
ncbi:His Kinase A (phospho-acceptor) domain-containing protein [Flavobacteriaceae bacterium MAR_2010_188]|nr:His Kinase A (phospho-acceptor) domain-containing protein [Flavobacteriaceae bacterium MAR_2010_188]